MKILIAIPCLNRGGTEMQTLNLVGALIDAGHSLTTICYFEYQQEVVNDYLKTGCEVELMKLQRGISPWKLINLLRHQFKELKPDVVHVQYMAPGALPILAARLAGVKKILATVHQPFTPSHGLLAKLLLRFSARLCTRFITVSQNAEISWFGKGRLFDENKSLQSQPRHFTIYNAVDVECIQSIQRRTDLQKEKQKLGIPSGQIVIGAVSRLRHEKGIDTLIHAFATVLKQNSAVHLLIVGTGPDESKLKELAVMGYGLRVSERGKCNSEPGTMNSERGTQISFFGEADWKTAMQQMALMDVVVVPSRFEGFGLTAAEAMAMGKPVVATSVFGLKEVVQHQKTGLLVQPNNIEDLASALSELALNLSLQQSMGKAGFTHAQTHFSLHVFKQKTMHLYNLLLSDK